MKNLMKLKNDKFVRASFIIVISFFIFQAANFLYHFLSARFFGPEEYAIVASIFSISYLIGIGSTTIQNASTKFTANFKSKNEDGKIIYLFERGNKKLFLYSLILFFVYLLISPLIAEFLKISIWNALAFSPFMLLTAVLPLNRGILQGLQKFNAFGVNLILEGVVRLVAMLLLFYLGMKANGAILAVSISFIFALIFTFPSLKFKKNAKIEKFDSKEIYGFFMISFIALFLITAIFNLDVFLVKHFFSAENAGFYSALSILGKIVFFGSTAICLVMFPKVAEMQTKKGKEKEKMKIFEKSLLFTFIISAGITLFYFLFSKFLINLLLGQRYSPIHGLIGYFGIAMVFLSLSYTCILYKLALGKKRFILIVASALIIEIIAICVFHNSLWEIIKILITINILMFALLIKK